MTPGVSVSLFKELACSPEPFLCYICYQRSQLAVTEELRSEVAHLKSEITKLSEQLAMAKQLVQFRPSKGSNHCKSIIQQH